MDTKYIFVTGGVVSGHYSRIIGKIVKGKRI